MKRLLIFFCVMAVCLLALPAVSQIMKWKIVAPTVLKTASNGPGSPAEYGAITAKGRTVLAGWSNLMLSTDAGISWSGLTIPFPLNSDFIMDIAIYDDNIFAITAFYHGAYLSNNRGLSWQHIDANSGGESIVFDGSPTRLISTHITNVGYISVPGNLAPFILPTPYGAIVRVAADGTLRILGEDPSNAALYLSSDHAATWVKSSQINQPDNYSFIPDPTDAGRYAIINEAWIVRNSGRSNIYLTTDNGGSWTNPYSQPLGDFTDLCGNGTAGCHDYFVGTKTNGILRSTDKGLSWQSIGGPPTPIDSRTIVALDDSLIYAIDTIGNIWATDVQIIGAGGNQVLGNQYFQQLTIKACDTSVISKIYFFNSSCIKYNISSLKLTGKDTSQYQIVGNLSSPFAYPDSVRILFTPTTGGKTDAHLKVTYANGSFITLDLGVNVSLSPFTFSKPSLFAGDSISLCGSKADSLFLRSPCPLDINSISLTGTDTASFHLTSKNSGVLPVDSLVRVVCTPKHTGNLSATLHIIFRDGRTIDVPMSVKVGEVHLSFIPQSLFTNDTIAICKSDTAYIHLKADCPLNVSSLAIEGTDILSFAMSRTTATLPGDSVITIICNPQREGDLLAQLHLSTLDGRSFFIPISLTVLPCPLDITGDLFGDDTILVCSSDSGFIHLNSAGKDIIPSITIAGADAASFSLHGKNSALLPDDSLIPVFCNPQRIGDLTAAVHFVANDGRTWDIALHITIKATPLSYEPSVLFSGDSIISCASDSTLITFSAPCPLSLSSISITGADALSFVIDGKNSAALPNDSILRVHCLPKHSGNLIASLHIVSSDGRSWDVPLNIFAEDPPLALQPSILFSNAVLEFCSAQVDTLKLSVACPLDISSISVIGPDNASFIILTGAPLELPKDSAIFIECIPQHSGILTASLHLVSVTGKSWDIPLAPDIKAKPTVAFGNISGGFTDVIGGDVTIPIHLIHSGITQDASFIVQYDTISLVYQGVFDDGNIDKTFSHPTSKTAKIVFNTEDTILYLKFLFFPVDSDCTEISIDSLTGANGAENCLNVLSSSIPVSICSPEGCGRISLARFLKFGKLPEIGVVPNPNSGRVTITSSLALGEASISITDALGITKFSASKELSPIIPANLNLEFLPSGIYYLHIQGLLGILPIIIEK
jgi:hypothetical protein